MAGHREPIFGLVVCPLSYDPARDTRMLKSETVKLTGRRPQECL